MADSSVTIVGNLLKEPEIRYTSGGRAQLSFGLAVNRRYQVNNEWQEQTSFFNVVAWGSLAENAAASLAKGTRVIVSGRLEQRSYETKEGEKRTIVDVIADARGDGGGAGGGGNYGGGGGGGSQAGGARSSGGGGGDPVYGDEEPF